MFQNLLQSMAHCWLLLSGTPVPSPPSRRHSVGTGFTTFQMLTAIWKVAAAQPSPNLNDPVCTQMVLPRSEREPFSGGGQEENRHWEHLARAEATHCKMPAGYTVVIDWLTRAE